MNRRATLGTLLGRKSKKQIEVDRSQEAITTVASGLTPFSGNFDRVAAAHLLRRVTIAPNLDQIRQAVEDGFEATMSKIFTISPATREPINPFYNDDPHCAIGESWVDQPSIADSDVWSYRRESLFSWTALQLLDRTISIKEKLVLFWHNHFVIADIDDPRYIYNYSRTLRTYALGNFREFAKAITVDPAMLRFLNNNTNTVEAPNENYARELLELFTVGKGDLVAPGDYTNYTEADIEQIAKILTGWDDVGWFTEDATPLGAAFDPNKHDYSDKQLSHRFDHAIIEGVGRDEYKNLIDIIFQQPACAKYICTRLYRWFVSDHIDETVRMEVIDPLAGILIDNDYEIQPVLETLFRSEHFFSDAAIGCVIKSPIDYMYGILRQLEMDLTTDGDEALYEQTLDIFYNANVLGQQYYQPPNVAGWKAYYQEPGLHRIWINSVSLPQRSHYAYKAVKNGFDYGESHLFFDPLKLVNKMDVPNDPNEVVAEFALLLLPRSLSIQQADVLKNELIPGLPDFEWTIEYTNYALAPGNDDLRIPLETKLRKMLLVMTSMAEYQLA